MNIEKFREVIARRRYVEEISQGEWADGIEECQKKEIELLTEDIPTTIDLYDEEDAQANAFAVNVGNIKTQLKSTVEGITSAINTYIESEIDSILLAKQQSTDAMTNMNA